MVAYGQEDLDVGDVAVGSGELGQPVVKIAQIGPSPQRAEQDVDLLGEGERALLEITFRQASREPDLERGRRGEHAHHREDEQNDETEAQGAPGDDPHRVGSYQSGGLPDMRGRWWSAGG